MEKLISLVLFVQEQLYALIPAQETQWEIRALLGKLSIFQERATGREFLFPPWMAMYGYTAQNHSGNLAASKRRKPASKVTEKSDGENTGLFTHY